MQIEEEYRVTLDSSVPDLKGCTHPMKGRVVYVHPEGRFATLEFQGVNGKLRESFWPEELTVNNRVQKKECAV